MGTDDIYTIVQTFELTNFKVWTVLSTEENVLLRGLLPEMSSFVPSAITRPFFELQTPDFAWKFVWTVPTNYEKKFVITYIHNYAITQPFFELQTPDFAWKFVWTVPTNYENFFCNYVITYIRNYVIIT